MHLCLLIWLMDQGKRTNWQADRPDSGRAVRSCHPRPSLRERRVRLSIVQQQVQKQQQQL